MHSDRPEGPAERRPTQRALQRSEEHTSELQSQSNLVCRLLLEKKKKSRRDEVPDIRQESYPRVYEAPQKERPHAPKALLFTSARSLMFYRARRERIVSLRARR